jgi:dTDP-4-amino-4,6-dideoxygalactose transaminase
MLLPLKVTHNRFTEHFSKEMIIKDLTKVGIDTRPPLTGNFLKQPALLKFLKDEVAVENFPNSNDISETAFLVGCHPDLSEEQVDYLPRFLEMDTAQIMFFN